MKENSSTKQNLKLFAERLLRKWCHGWLLAVLINGHQQVYWDAQKSVTTSVLLLTVDKSKGQKSKLTIASLLNHDSFFRTMNKAKDISVVSPFLFHTNEASQIKGGQHQFTKLSFYDLSKSRHFTSSKISSPLTRLPSILSYCPTMKNRTQPKIWKKRRRDIFPFFPQVTR